MKISSYLSYPEIWPIQRNLYDHKILLQRRVKKGSIRKSLTGIEPTSSPPDHLHMRKGLISRLLNQVTDMCII